MKKLLTLLSLSLPLLAFAQNKVWQVPVKVENIQLRGPEATVLDSIITNLPDSGTVHIRFDGHCTSYIGDRIILAASSYPDWNSNDGNTDVRAVDSFPTTQPFNHTRVYAVGPGQQTFYAVAHNYVDIEGPGIASISGQLTVEYFPNIDLQWKGKGFVGSGFEIATTATIVDSLHFETPSAGRILVSVDGLYYNDFDDTMAMTTSLSPFWPTNGSVDTFKMSQRVTGIDVIHNKLIAVGPGQHTLHMLMRKLWGQPDYNRHWFYGTLNILFIPDELEVVKSVEVPEHTTIEDAGIQDIAELNFPVTEKGSMLINFHGRLNSTLGDQVKFYIEYDGQVNPVILDTQVVQTVVVATPPVYFSNSALTMVEPGNNRIRVYAQFDSTSYGTGAAEVTGMLTARFIPEAEVTSTTHLVSTPTLAFYPNPTVGELHAIPGDDAIAGPCVIRVADASGREVFTTQSDMQHIRMDLRDFANGLYMISVQQGDAVQVHPVLKVAADQ